MIVKNALRQIDIQDMLIFMTVIAQGSSRDASYLLGLSPSTISYSLKRLRECFDDDLFLVRRGTMAPTPKAHAIAPYIQAAIDSINRCAGPEDVPQGGANRRMFRVQAPEYFELLVLPRIVASIAAPFRITFETERLGPELDVERLQAGKLDLAFGFGPGYHRIHPDLDWRSILDDDFVCLTSVPSLEGSRLSLDDFLAHSHVHPTPWDAANNMVDGWLKSIQRERHVIAKANTYQACVNIIDKTPLLFSLPRGLLPLLKVPDSLLVVEPPMGFPIFTLDLIWPKHQANKSRWLRDQLSSVLNSL